MIFLHFLTVLHHWFLCFVCNYTQKRCNMKNWHLYDKARDIASRLAESVIEPSAAGADAALGDDVPEAVRKIGRIFSDPDARTALYAEFEKTDSSEAVLRLRRAIRRRRRKRFLWRCAAAAVVMTFLLWGGMRIGVSPTDTFLPDKPQAVLIMSNGERVGLAEFTRMNEMDGTAIVRNQAGELVYQSDSCVSQALLYNTVIVPRHGEYSLVLADGSRIVLNSESELRYPIAFSGNRREVFLKGEAWLEISPDDRPFVVHAYDARIQVYGTRFNINSYNPEKIDVVLVEGKVGISREEGDEVILFPDQLAHIDARTGISVEKDINADYYIAWQNGCFAFENERLEDILAAIARWYDFEVLYSRPDLKEICFTALLSREQPLENILEHFRKTGSISFRIHKNQILIE